VMDTGTKKATLGGLKTSSEDPKYDTSFQCPLRQRSRTKNVVATPSSNRAHELYVVAVNENRMKEVGIAIMNLRKPELLLTQFTDSKSYSFALSKLAIYAPVEVLLPNTSTDSELYETVKKYFDDTALVNVSRKYFNESYGAQMVSQLVVTENDSIEHSISSKYLALASAAALIKYVEFIQHMTFAPHSLKVRGRRDTRGAYLLFSIDSIPAHRRHYDDRRLKYRKSGACCERSFQRN